jgi:hypothetical protein
MPALLALVGVLLAAAPATPAPSAPEDGPLPTIAIDLAGLDRPMFRQLQAAGVYQGLVLRLVNEQIALVSPHEQSDFVLRFLAGEREGELRILASSLAVSRERLLAVGPPSRLDEEAVQLELLHAAVELVRQVRALTPPRPRGDPVYRLRIEVGGGALFGGGTTGLLGRVAGARRAGPVELGLALAVHRPLSLPASLSVVEWGAFGVVGSGERALGRRVRVSAALDLGVWQHRWRYSRAGSSDAGARLDLAGLLHAEAAWRLSPSWRAGLTAGVLGVSRGHRHRDGGGTLWHASSIRPFAGLTLGFGREGESG